MNTGTDEDEDDIYCEIKITLDQSKKLLRLVSVLNESGAHPELESVFVQMQNELKLSIDLVENPRDWKDLERPKH